MSIATLLADSISAHKRAQGNRKGRPADWRDLLTTAATLRRQAEAEDPTFSDPAWADESRHTPTGVNTHAVLTAFYESKGLNG